VVAVGDEAKRQRQSGEHQRPGVQVGDRAAAGEADARHPVMEVLAVGAVDRLAVLQPLEHDERRVEERHGQQDQRQHERDDSRRLDGCLDRDHAHHQAEQVRAAVAHEARRRREVVEEETECRAGRQRREDSRLRAAEVERDHRHRAGDDRADAGCQAVNAVGEVDDVHHQHEPEHGQDRTGVRHAGVRECERADERQRDRLHGDAVVNDDHRRDDLTRELDDRRQLEAIVDRADERDHGCGQQHAMPQLMFGGIAGRQPDQRRDERAGEDRKAAEQRRRILREAALTRFVDGADGLRDAHRERRQQRRHGGGYEKGVKRVELVRMRHESGQHRRRRGHTPAVGVRPDQTALPVAISW
jgi:hypothetical protein